MVIFQIYQFSLMDSIILIKFWIQGSSYAETVCCSNIFFDVIMWRSDTDSKFMSVNMLTIYRYQFSISYCIFGMYIKFGTFWNKNEPHRSSISEVTDSERRAYLNA